MTTKRLRERRLGRSLSLAAFLALVGLDAACGGQTALSEECLPGDYQAIRLGDGGSGFLVCDPAGTAYIPYEGPDPNVPPAASSADAGSEDAAAACSTAGGAKLGFMCPGCATDDDCQSGLVCFDFPNKTGNLCTRDCTPPQQAALCPPPSEGCGNNGHCKP